MKKVIQQRGHRVRVRVRVRVTYLSYPSDKQLPMTRAPALTRLQVMFLRLLPLTAEDNTSSESNADG